MNLSQLLCNAEFMSSTDTLILNDRDIVDTFLGIQFLKTVQNAILENGISITDFGVYPTLQFVFLALLDNAERNESNKDSL